MKETTYALSFVGALLAVALAAPQSARAEAERPAFTELGLDVPLLESAIGGSLTAGYFLVEGGALEVGLDRTHSIGDAVRDRTAVRLGLRFAPPKTVSWIVSAAIGYEYAERGFRDSPDGLAERHALNADFGVGLQINWRWFMASTLVRARTALVAWDSIERPNWSRHTAAFETRVGVRF